MGFKIPSSNIKRIKGSDCFCWRTLFGFPFKIKNSNTNNLTALIVYKLSQVGHSCAVESLLLVGKFQQQGARKHKRWPAKPGAVKTSVTLCRCRAHGELPYMLEFLFVWAWPRFQAPGGSELAGLLLGIKPGPRAGERKKKKWLVFIVAVVAWK